MGGTLDNVVRQTRPFYGGERWVRTEGEKGPPRGDARAPRPAGAVAGTVLRANKGQGRPPPAVSGARRGQETPGQAL